MSSDPPARRGRRLWVVAGVAALAIVAVLVVLAVRANDAQNDADGQARIAEEAEAEVVDVLRALSDSLVQQLALEQAVATGGGGTGAPATTSVIPGPETCDAVPPDLRRSRLNDLRASDTRLIANRLDDAVDLIWISPSGKRIAWDTVEAGSSGQIDVITGWVWIAEDGSGTCRLLIN